MDPDILIPTETWHWIAFSSAVVVLLILDLTVFHRQSHEPSLRESAFWTIVWTSMAAAFNVGLYFWALHAWQAQPHGLSAEDAHEKSLVAALFFLSGYLIEWSLSMDNVFVFAIVFTFFRVPLKFQHRVLFWGILGAIVMRLSFILIGAALLERFHALIAVFGLFLIYTAWKLATSHEEVHPDKNILMRMARKVFPVTRELHGNSFFVREEGRLCITPLFLVLLVIESTDVLFAIDSVPAIFGITKDPFIVFTSNVFAILGLRALYFLLAGVMDMFRYLKYGLAVILGFVGIKMIAEFVAEHQGWLKGGPHYWIIFGSLGFIVVTLAVSIIASLIANRREAALNPNHSQAAVERAVAEEHLP